MIADPTATIGRGDAGDQAREQLAGGQRDERRDDPGEGGTARAGAVAPADEGRVAASAAFTGMGRTGWLMGISVAPAGDGRMTPARAKRRGVRR